MALVYSLGSPESKLWDCLTDLFSGVVQKVASGVKSGSVHTSLSPLHYKREAFRVQG